MKTHNKSTQLPPPLTRTNIIHGPHNVGKDADGFVVRFDVVQKQWAGRTAVQQIRDVQGSVFGIGGKNGRQCFQQTQRLFTAGQFGTAHLFLFRFQLVRQDCAVNKKPVANPTVVV
jgi:hypothetical protein